MTKSQTTLENSVVIKKIGNWTVELFDHNHLVCCVVTNGNLIDYPVVHANIVAYDNPYAVPQSIKNWLLENRRQVSHMILEREIFPLKLNK